MIEGTPQRRGCVLLVAGFLLWFCFCSAALAGDAQDWVDKGLGIAKTAPNSDKEAACYRKALVIEPGHAAANFNLAFVLDSQASAAWRGADTGWETVGKLHRALDHYCRAAEGNPARGPAYANAERIAAILLKGTTKRPPDLYAIRTDLRHCRQAAAKARTADCGKDVARLDSLIEDAEQRLTQLAQAKLSNKFVTADELCQRLRRRFSRGASPYQGPRVPLMIQFEYNSDTVNNASTAQLQEMAKAVQMTSLRDKVFLVEGHTDSAGSSPYNQNLSERRAKAVKTFLVKHGVASERIQTKGFGEDRPLVPNDSNQHQAMNRRVEFVNLGELQAFKTDVQKRSRSGAVSSYDVLY